MFLLKKKNEKKEIINKTKQQKQPGNLVAKTPCKCYHKRIVRPSWSLVIAELASARLEMCASSKPMD